MIDIDLSHVGIRILIGVVVILLGFMLLKYFSKDGEHSITEYAAPVPQRPQRVLKNPKKLLKKLELPKSPRNYEFAPSPVDATMSPYGEWDTNRFPNSFVTNVSSGFPENDEGASAARPNKWTPPTPANFTIPDLTMRDELGTMSTPPLGSDDPFDAPLGASWDN
ncbi:hypothetical protein PBCVNEJV1_028R [Paramecium bursaria Chlorella virus NE-JV-1]|nr:hypothetical protein PBCVNEJV1_028R [Paramecium bursaria Chlorella virus NE-JV-1]